MGWVPQGIGMWAALRSPVPSLLHSWEQKGVQCIPLGVIETTVCLSGKELVPVGSFSLSPLGTAAV